MDTSSLLPQRPDHNALRLSSALLGSILLHTAALMLLLFVAYARPMLEVPPLLDVDLVSLPPPPARPAPPAPPAPPAQAPAAAEKPPEEAIPLPNRQIVNPADAGREEAPKQTRFLSDRDNTVDEEKVHRGEPKGGPETNPQTAQEAPPKPARQRNERAAAPPQPKPQPPAPARAARPRPAPAPPPRAGATDLMAKAPRLDQLLPDAGTLAREGSLPSTGTDEPAHTAEKPNEQRDVLKYADLGRAPGGTGGTLDFLPDVREGDVTLLNTKAELFAPFVRRVAQRVFQNQIISLRRELGSASVSAQESVTVEAIMDKRGRPVSLKIVDRSTTGATGIDRHLQRACQQAFFDLNPPHGAEAADGNIHFVFRTQVRVAVGPAGVRYGALLMAGLQ